MVGAAPVGMNQKNLYQVTEPDHQNKDHDADFQAPESPQLKRQNGKNAHCRNDRGNKHHRGPGKPQMEEVAAKKQVEAERGAKFGQIGGQRRKLGRYP